MANPTRVQYRIPTSNTDGTPLAAADIRQIDLGLGTTSGQYPTIVADTTFAPGENGLSDEALSRFGVLPPGTYFLAARTVSRQGIMSAWSEQVSFTVEPPVPNPPEALSVS
jgi:hypothetical protein